MVRKAFHVRRFQAAFGGLRLEYKNKDVEDPPGKKKRRKKRPRVSKNRPRRPQGMYILYYVRIWNYKNDNIILVKCKWILQIDRINLYFEGVSEESAELDLVWGVEAEGDDEGEDETDVEKENIGQENDIVNDGFDPISKPKTLAMVEMEVEDPHRDITNTDAKWLLNETQLTAHLLPSTETKENVPWPIQFSSSKNKKQSKPSPIILR